MSIFKSLNWCKTTNTYKAVYTYTFYAKLMFISFDLKRTKIVRLKIVLVWIKPITYCVLCLLLFPLSAAAAYVSRCFLSSLAKSGAISSLVFVFKKKGFLLINFCMFVVIYYTVVWMCVRIYYRKKKQNNNNNITEIFVFVAHTVCVK